MSGRDLTASELRILVAIDRTESFSAAARELGLTQSAVSHAVGGAERKIGAVLFRRDRGGARPTAAGAAAIGHARRVLRLLDTMKQEARAALAGEMTGTVRVAAFRGAAFNLLPGVLARFGRRHPRITVDVSVVRETGQGVPGQVRDGHADLGIATLFAPVDDLVGKLLFDDPYVLVYPAGHPDPYSLPSIHWNERASSETESWCARQTWLSTSDIRVEDDGVAMSMVGHGLGTAVVPRMSFACAPPKVAMRQLGPDAPVRRVGYVITPEMLGSAAVRALISELRAQIPATALAPVPERRPS
ncbi:LysR family transcriptional regulator [Actinomadura roseirufa]|uniref:LysR family transcriptional regulator n=1 Tax=Actinomadura roseirufa TaxID=2094049 RepID=UPI001041235D|nr:LysR family transcriptional regulator [Actinomadura roseirufa]